MNWFLKDKIEKDVVDKVDKLKAVTDELGVTLAQFSLAWCLRTPNITSAIIGASRKQQVLENAKAVEIVFTDELENKVKEIFYS
jgi:aryl-alcohol dehydrogenase-like predicted oxidoreductase